MVQLILRIVPGSDPLIFNKPPLRPQWSIGRGSGWDSYRKCSGRGIVGRWAVGVGWYVLMKRRALKNELKERSQSTEMEAQTRAMAQLQEGPVLLCFNKHSLRWFLEFL